MIRRRVHFSGRVQGVGFRATASDCAAKRAVSGWVRNEPDGSVVMEVQGEAGEVAAVLGLLRARMGVKIAGEESVPLDVEHRETGFVIAR